MTREEQLACLKDRPCSVCKFHTDRCNRWTCVFEDEPEEQEPCEDCISREFIEIVVNYPPDDLCCYPEYKGKPYYSIKYRENGKEYYAGFGTYDIKILSQWIKEYFITGVQPKTGHWEWVQYDYNPKLGNWHCSECRSVVVECVSKEEKGGIPLYKYCPQCGAKMESEDKE